MKLSIITINYNSRDGLRKTIESIVNQTWQEFEYIIIDGGSTDGSVEVIKEYADRINYWVSEPDMGIYDAMNKGVVRAKGEYCLFMNSADTFYDSTVIDHVFPLLDNTDIICGQLKFPHGYIMKGPKEVSMQHFYTSTLPHQATFIKTQLLISEPYDTSYRIVSDWKFWIQSLIFKNATYKTIDYIIAVFDVSGISSTHEDLRIEEQKKVFDELIPPRILCDYYTHTHGNTYEEKLYFVIKAHKWHKLFYTLNIFCFKFFSLFNKRTKWVKEFPFKI